MIGKVYSNSFKMCSMSFQLHNFIPTTFASNVGGTIFTCSLQMERHMQFWYWSVNGECDHDGESSGWCFKILSLPTFSPSLWFFSPLLPLSNYTLFCIHSVNSMTVILHTTSWSSSSSFNSMASNFFHSFNPTCVTLNCLTMFYSFW